MQKKLVSICIPAYNAAAFIAETIQSWQNQTYSNIEIIIQDDCSTDCTYQIALEYAKSDTRIKVFRNEINYGIGKNWNECYDHVLGEYTVIFNADDTINSNFIDDSLSIMKTDENLDFVIHNFIKSNEIDKLDEIEKNALIFEGKTFDIINITNNLNKRIHWNYTFTKKLSLDKLKNKYGLFYPTQVCDGMLWFEAYKHKLFAYYSPIPIGIYRDHENNNSKIKFGEFESTFLWMLPLYSDIFLLKHPGTFYTISKTIIGYLYNCIKNAHRPKLMVIFNLLKYGS